MKIPIAALILAALARAAAAQQLEAFPYDSPFRSPVADPAEPRLFISRLEVRRPDSEFAAGFVGIGVDFPLLKRHGTGPEDGWQLSFFGSVDSLFNLDLPDYALVNTDYRVGFPLTWRQRALSMRARLYHQSSHLGDELILGGNAPTRLDVSFEAVDLLGAWESPIGLRLYGGGGYVARSSIASYRRAIAHAGIDYLSGPVLYGQRLTFGLDAKWLEAADWRSGVSLKAGIKFGRISPEPRGISLLLEAYDGFAPFGQFFVEDIRYFGATVQFDL